MQKPFKRTLSFVMIFLLIFTSSAFAIDVEIEDPTPDLEPPQLHSISGSSQTLTPTTPIKVTANITDSLSGVKRALIYFKKPSGKTTSFTFAYNSTSKLYEASVSVGTIDEPGNWKVHSVQLYDNKDNSIAIDRNNFDFTHIDLQVSGVQLPELPKEPTDKEAPVLHNIQVESQEVDSGERIKITAVVTDNESGIYSVIAYYRKPSGRSYSISLSKNAATGNFEGSKVVNQYEELGEWKLDYVYLQDNAYNSVRVKTYKDSHNTEKNFDHCNLIISGTTPDLQGPVLDDLAIEVNQISSNQASVKLTAKVSDELSGVSSVSGSYRKPSGKTIYLSFSRSGDSYITTIPIDKYDELGKWELKYISATDNMGNTTTINDRDEERYFNGFDINVNGKITISPGFPFSIDLGTNSLSLQSSDSYQLKPILNYTDKTSQDITSDSLTKYTSSNPDLVQVGKTGLITVPEGAKAGYATVGVSYGNIEKSITVKINGGSDNGFLKITPLTKTLSAGQKEQIQVLEIKNGITKDVTKSDSGIKYTSLTPSLASVSIDGAIQVAQGIEKGTAIIQVVYGDLIGQVKINITKPSVKSLVISPTEESLSLTNNKLQLVVKAFMNDGTTKDVTNSSQGTIYKSSNEAVAKVSPDGLVTIPSNAKSGVVTIIATNNYLTVKSIITVAGNPELVNLDLSSIPKEMNIGDENTVILQSEWSDGTTKELTLGDVVVTSSRSDRVAIFKEGVISALSIGASNITIQYEGKTFNTSVKVLPPPSVVNFYLDKPFASQMKIGEEISLTELKAEWSNGEITHVNAKDVTISSSRPDRVLITEKGSLRALASGSSNIDIKYGTKIISVSVKVESGPTISSIYLENEIPTTMKINDDHSIGILKAKWSNGEETVIDNSLVTFSSSRSDRISVTEDGKLKAVSVGTSYIDITYEGKTIRTAVKCETGPTLSGIILEEPLPVTMVIGEQATIDKVKARWSNGEETIIDVAELQFKSSRPDRVSVTEDGVLTALTSGTSYIDIFYEGIALRYSVKVVSGPTISSIYLENNPPTSIKIGNVIPIGVVKARWSNGEETTIPTEELIFNSSRQDRINVTEDGKMEALTIGSSNIDINYQGKNIRISLKAIK